jgi:hypothetical protein
LIWSSKTGGETSFHGALKKMQAEAIFNYFSRATISETQSQQTKNKNGGEEAN